MTRTKKSPFSLQRLLVVCFAASTLQVTQANNVVSFAVEPSTTIVQAGHGAVLDCVVRSSNFSLDTINVQWLDAADGQPISFLGDTYRSQLLNNSLYVSSVLPDIGVTGHYQCKASLPNGAGSIVSRRAELALAWLGDFEEEPREGQEIVAYAGEKVHFPCRISGQPAPVRVRWLKDERPLSIDELRMTILPSGGLEIDEISEADQGTYRCNASSMNLHRVSGRATLVLNSDMEEAALAAKAAPTFIVKPQSRVTVTEGQTVTLDCAANGNPHPKMKWLKNGANIDMADLDSRFSKVGTTSSLKISNIQEEDGGTYQCLAENREDSLDASATVQVQVPPKFKRKPSDKIEYVSKDVELECVVYGKPEPQVQWLKNGELIHPTGYHQIVNGNNLKIMGLLQSDTGLFQCIASNAAGNVQGSASLRVISQEQSSNNKKQRRKKFNKSLSSASNQQQPAEQLQASQALFASLKPSNTLPQPPPRPKAPNSFQILTSLSSSSASDNTNLGSTLNAYSQDALQLNRKRIQQQSQSQQFDESLFDNDDGDDNTDDSEGVGSSWVVDTEGVADVAAVNRPGPPTDITAVVTKARFLVLSWKAPPVSQQGDDIVVYSVFYRQEGNPRERVQNTTVGGVGRRPSSHRTSQQQGGHHVEEAHLSNLQPSTTYVIRVVAWNHHGMGSSSHPVSITTAFEENNVPGAPRHLHAYATSSRSAHVQWTEPEEAPEVQSGAHLNGARGDVRYRVNYIESDNSGGGGGGSGEQLSVETVNTQLHLVSLSPYTLYTVWVESLNLNGLGSSSAESQIRTLGSLPADAPQNITIEPTSSTSLLIRWEPPPAAKQNGAITGYKIRYRLKNSKADTVTVEGGARTYGLRGLERGSVYQLRMWAMNVNGTGPPTDWLDADTYESDLDESRVPDAPGDMRTKATGNTITIYWTPPHNTTTRVRNYIIGWGKGVPDMFSHELSEREREYTISPLEAQSEYVVSLRASNEMGAGVPRYANIRTVLDSGGLDRLAEEEERNSPLLPPIGVKAQVLGETSAVLYWTDTTTLSKGGGDRYYVVHYQAEGLNKAKEVNVSTNNILLSELRPGTMYEFMVKVVKGRRESPWSMVVVNYTSGSSPSSLNTAPRELQVKLLQDASQMVRLSWLPPKPSGSNINGYVILFTTDQSKRDRDWNATAVKGDRLTYDITNLEPSARYYFKVQARINKGNGPFTATVTIETGPNIGIPPPVNKAGLFSGTMLLYMIGGALVLVVITIILVVFCLCCRRGGVGGSGGSGTTTTTDHRMITSLGTSPDRSKKGYQGVSSGSCGQGGIKPPDLWIHHDQMELKHMDCGSKSDAASSSGALTLPRNSGDDYAHQHHHHHHAHAHHINSLDKRGYAPTYMDDSSCQHSTSTIKRQAAAVNVTSMTTTTIKPKPLTLTQLMQQHQSSHSWEPVASAMNTSISSTTPLSGGGSGYDTAAAQQHRDSLISTSTPMRPTMTALQQQQQQQQNAPTTYDPYSCSGGGYGAATMTGAAAAMCSIVQHPLKSFTVPAPPPISAPGTPKHVVTMSPPLPVSYYHHNHHQQQQPLLVRPTTANTSSATTTTTTSNNQSPYRKPSVVVASPCIGGNAGGGGSSGSSTPPPLRTALPPHTADEVQRLTVGAAVGGVRPSHSTEELNQEMEHLKGLMITLNKITANEFEC